MKNGLAKLIHTHPPALLLVRDELLPQIQRVRDDLASADEEALLPLLTLEVMKERSLWAVCPGTFVE